MELYGRSPAVDPTTGLEEPMWQLGLGPAFPERPGEPDCAYYLRTGTCGYGDSCRYNHPRDRGTAAGAVRIEAPEYPDRVGQPVCEYFLKTGTCKFGVNCKYHHPRQGGGSARPASLNYYGYPLRPGEKECVYYMRTGQCKFGMTCKFHHPQPAGASVPSPAPVFYPSVQPATAPSPHQYSAMASWQVARPSVLPSSYIQGPYGPMLLSPGVVPVPGWSPYAPPVNPVVPLGGQQTAQAGSVYGLQTQLSPSATAYTGYQPVSSSAGPSSSIHKEHTFPERPGQPECQFYMRTGDCKFGSTCKYHHPPGSSAARTNCILSPIGLPLRPGARSCAFYAQHGICKFGPTCKFDHPMGMFSYSPSASSLSDMPIAPYPVGLLAPTLAPSSSSSDLRPEFGSNKNSFSTRMPSSENLSSGSVGSIFSTGGFLPQSVVQLSGQASAQSSRSSSMGHGGEVSSLS